MSIKESMIERIKNLEQLANNSLFEHTKILGMLEEARRILNDINDIVETVKEPEQPPQE